MASLGRSFQAVDAGDAATAAQELLPAGDYRAEVATAEVKPTKNGQGKRLLVKFRILNPLHAGKSVFVGLNIQNTSAEAERIGQQQLGRLVRAIGLAHADDSDQLIGGSCEIKVTVRPARGDYAASNDITDYRPDSQGAKKAPPVADEDVPF